MLCRIKLKFIVVKHSVNLPLMGILLVDILTIYNTSANISLINKTPRLFQFYTTAKAVWYIPSLQTTHTCKLPADILHEMIGSVQLSLIDTLEND